MYEITNLILCATEANSQKIMVHCPRHYGRCFIQICPCGILISVCSPTTEECDEDNMGGAGPSSGQHQAQCSQTSGQSVAEQHT